MLLKTKSPAFLRDFYYLDGLVSTGKRNSLHNIKNNFFYSKKFSNKFYTHFFSTCGKQLQKLLQKFDEAVDSRTSMNANFFGFYFFEFAVMLMNSAFQRIHFIELQFQSRTTANFFTGVFPFFDVKKMKKTP